MPNEQTRTLVLIKSLASEKGFYDSDGKVTAVFKVEHSDTEFTVDQELILIQTPIGWTAEMPMLDFPPQKTVTAAAWKLAEWMEKMGAAIKDHTFDSINLNEL